MILVTSFRTQIEVRKSHTRFDAVSDDPSVVCLQCIMESHAT